MFNDGGKFNTQYMNINPYDFLSSIRRYKGTEVASEYTS